MNESLIAFINTFARDVAQLGHSVRTENLEDVEKTNKYSQDISYIMNELDGLGIKRFKENLVKCFENMMSAYELRDAVTLADVLEYELLHECEEILYALEK
jgi:hypothetical protein